MLCMYVDTPTLLTACVCLSGRTMRAPNTPSVLCVPWWAWYQWLPTVSGLNLGVSNHGNYTVCVHNYRRVNIYGA